MIIENTPLTQAQMALGAAITELYNAQRAIIGAERTSKRYLNLSEARDLLGSLAFQARLVLTLVESKIETRLDQEEESANES